MEREALSSIVYSRVRGVSSGYGRKGPIVSPFYGAVFLTLDPMTNIFITRTQRS